ncbi:LVIVD repeat-containing protein, partial [Kaarinaea lacus]
MRLPLTSHLRIPATPINNAGYLQSVDWHRVTQRSETARFLTMLNHNVKLFVYASLLLVLLGGCQSEPEFADNDSITVTVGKAATRQINVKNWGNDDQLVMTPGGPYLKNRFPITQPVKFMRSMKEQVVYVDTANQLSVVDFSLHGARRIAQLDLEDQVTAVAEHDQLLIVSFKHQGLALFDLSALPAISEVTHFKDVAATIRIKVFNDKIYALTNDQRLLIFDTPQAPYTKTVFKPGNSLKLPAPSIDFTIFDQHAVVIGPDYGIATLLLSDPRQFLSTVPLQNEPKSLQVNKGIAYVADGKTGLIVFDAHDPQQLQWLGSHNKFDAINDVYVSGDRAFVLDHDMRVATLNISNRRLPITGSFYKPAHLITCFVAQEDEVYLATKDSIEQISFPGSTHSQISNEGINQGGSRRAYIDNNIAYVADWFSGLHLYDISDPANIHHIANYHTPGSSKGVVVDNGYAFVGDDDHGLQIIDVRNPQQPVKVSEIMTTGLAYTLKKRGNLIYLADHRGGFHIIDVSNVKNPRLLSSYDTPGKSWAIDVVADIAYVADDTSGLLIFDVSNARQPKQIGQFDPHGAAEDVLVKDQLAYVSFFDKGLYVLDISKPAQPEVVSQLPIPGNARSIDIVENYAYIAGWESGLNIVDISDPAAPRLAGHYDTKGSAWGADVSNGYAYIWDWWGGVLAVNVENPHQPQLAGKYHARGNIVNLRQKSNYIYTANGSGGVQVFDINNPLNPIWATGIDFPGRVIDIWPSSNSSFAFAANG